MKLTVKLKWIEERNRWDILKENGFTMYDVPACENMDMLFDHPRKDIIEEYEVTINRIEK
jgi:hypothetical protein